VTQRVPLKELLEKLPVTEGFDCTLASPIYVEKVISCVVAGDKVMTLIWEEHFCRQVTIKDVAHRANYSTRSISRLINLFPEKVAYQLWLKNHELTKPQKTALSIKTVQQQQKEMLFKAYGLTNKQSEIMLALARPGTPRRKEVAQELEITENTMGSHLGKIYKKMKVSKLSEATDKVRLTAWMRESDDKQN